MNKFDGKRTKKYLHESSRHFWKLEREEITITTCDTKVRGDKKFANTENILQLQDVLSESVLCKAKGCCSFDIRYLHSLFLARTPTCVECYQN